MGLRYCFILYLLSLGLSKELTARDFWGTSRRRANEHMRSEKYEEAITELEKLDPSSAVAYNKGYAFYNLGQYSEAISAFSEALELSQKINDPKVVNSIKEIIYYAQANSYFRLENYESAIVFYKYTLKINPSNEFAKDNLEAAEKALELKKNQIESTKNQFEALGANANLIFEKDLYSLLNDANSSGLLNDEGQLKEMALHTVLLKKDEKEKIQTEMANLNKEREELLKKNPILDSRMSEVFNRKKNLNKRVSEISDEEKGDPLKKADFEALKKRSQNWTDANFDETSENTSIDVGHQSGTQEYQKKEKLNTNDIIKNEELYWIDPPVSSDHFKLESLSQYKNETWSSLDSSFKSLTKSEIKSGPVHTHIIAQADKITQSSGRFFMRLGLLPNTQPLLKSFRFEDSKIKSYRILKNSSGDYLLSVDSSFQQPIRFSYDLMEAPAKERPLLSDSAPLMSDWNQETTNYIEKFIVPTMNTREKAFGLEALIIANGIYTKEDNELDSYIKNSEGHSKESKTKRLENLFLQNSYLPEQFKGRGMDCDCWSELYIALARSQGMKARMALGLLTESENPQTNNQAHGWVEVWDDESNEWFTVDPTPFARNKKNAQDMIQIAQINRKLEVLEDTINEEGPLKKEGALLVALQKNFEQSLGQRSSLGFELQKLNRMEAKTINDLEEKEKQIIAIRKKIIDAVKNDLLRSKSNKLIDPRIKRAVFHNNASLLEELRHIPYEDTNGDVDNLVEELKKEDSKLAQQESFRRLLGQGKNCSIWLDAEGRLFKSRNDSFRDDFIGAMIPGEVSIQQTIVSDQCEYFSVLGTNYSGKQLLFSHKGIALVGDIENRISDMLMSQDGKDIYFLKENGQGIIKNGKDLLNVTKGIISFGKSKLSIEWTIYEEKEASNYINGERTLSWGAKKYYKNEKLERETNDTRLLDFYLLGGKSGNILEVTKNTKNIDSNGKPIMDVNYYLGDKIVYRGKPKYYRIYDQLFFDDHSGRVLVWNGSGFVESQSIPPIDEYKYTSYVDLKNDNNGKTIYYVKKGDKVGPQLTYNDKPFLTNNGVTPEHLGGTLYYFKSTHDDTYTSYGMFMDVDPESGVVQRRVFRNAPQISKYAGQYVDEELSVNVSEKNWVYANIFGNKLQVYENGNPKFSTKITTDQINANLKISKSNSANSSPRYITSLTGVDLIHEGISAKSTLKATPQIFHVNGVEFQNAKLLESGIDYTLCTDACLCVDTGRGVFKTIKISHDSQKFDRIKAKRIDSYSVYLNELVNLLKISNLNENQKLYITKNFIYHVPGDRPLEEIEKVAGSNVKNWSREEKYNPDLTEDEKFQLILLNLDPRFQRNFSSNKNSSQDLPLIEIKKIAEQIKRWQLTEKFLEYVTKRHENFTLSPNLSGVASQLDAKW